MHSHKGKVVLGTTWTLRSASRGHPAEAVKGLLPGRHKRLSRGLQGFPAGGQLSSWRQHSNTLGCFFKD